MSQIINAPRLACWGDSLMLGFAPLLAQALGTKYRVENYGVGGETSSQIKTRFDANTASHSWPTLIWAGTNNLPLRSPQTVLTDVASMVASLTSDYLILTPFNGENGASYYQGGAIYQDLQTIVTGLQSTYRGHVYDVRSFLPQYLTSHTFGLSAQDTIDLAHDIIPSSFRVDQVHLTTAGYMTVASELAMVIQGSFAAPTNTLFDVPLYYATSTSGGRVGLGTDSPATRLHLDADTALGAVQVSNTAKTASFLDVGVSGGSSGIINGDALGDACLMANTGGHVWVSANNGGTAHFGVKNDGTLKASAQAALSAPAASQGAFGFILSNGKVSFAVRYPSGVTRILDTEL